MPRWRVAVEVEADNAALAAMTVTGPLYEDVDITGLYVTEVKEI